MWDFAGADHGHIARENRLRTKLGKQRDLLQLLSVGFSTRSARMQAAVSAVQHSARPAIPPDCGATERSEKWNR
jgi:hypothetical protein